MAVDMVPMAMLDGVVHSWIIAPRPCRASSKASARLAP